MLKVVIVTNSLTGGGAERSMNLLSNELGNCNIDTILIPINDGPEDAVKLTIPVLKVKKIWRGNFANTIKSFWKFYRILSSQRPDIVIANCDLPEFFVSITPGKFRIIVTEHVSRPWHTRKLMGIVIRTILRLRGAHWVAVSDYLRIWPWGFRPEVVIRNGILFPDRIEVKQNQELKRLLFIGRLVEQKNPDLVIKLSRLLNIPAEIIGDGPLMKSLKAESTAIESRVNFSGMQLEPWKSVLPGDLLIVPSNWEGDGLVVVEALSMGIPILLSTIPEFMSFNLEEVNYCQDVNQFRLIAHQFRNQIEKLIPTNDKRNYALKSRDLKQISEGWNAFFKMIRE